MLINGRFDFFSRSILEAPREYKARKEKIPSLMVEENLMLYYPFPVYFFTNFNNSKLARRLTRGIHHLINNGEYDKIFNKHYGEAIKRAGLSKRKVFRLKNPLLPKKVPINNMKYWYKTPSLRFPQK